jgi:polar amino acid transport system permease protein
MTRRRKLALIRVGVYAVTIAVTVLVLAQVDWERLREGFFDWDVATQLFPEVVTQGAKNTLIYTAFGYSGGLVLGLVLAVMRLSTIRAYRWFAAVYIEVLRGLPLLLTLLVIGFGIPLAFRLRLDDIAGIYAPGSVALALVAGAYIAETIRAGIEAVPRGQMEAARSLGMRYSRAMITIVIPQAFRIVVPPLTNELVLLVKDTSLISVLGVTFANKETLRFARDVVNERADATPLVVAGLIYLAITIPLTRLAGVLERRSRLAR